MNLTLLDSVRMLAALAVGGGLGYAFGFLQQVALRRHEEQERTGGLRNGWNLMPGSGVRVAYLVLALVLIQVICPLFFSDRVQWFVSGGVVLGYGWTLFQQLRLKLKQARV